MRRAGPYSSPGSLVTIDRRSREARIVAGTQAQLTAHVGGNPSATQRALIDRAAWLTLHVAQLDAKAANGGTMTEHDSRSYLAFSNSLTRTLAALGLDGPPQRPRTPAEVMATLTRPGSRAA